MRTRKILYLLLLASSVVCNAVTAQSKQLCATIVQNPETEAIYGKGKSDLSEYFGNTILPIISAQATKEKVAAGFGVNLTINSRGNVTKVDFYKGDLTETTKIAIIKKFLSMQKWRPATDKGRNVCSVYDFYVSCIYWND
jgi:hypothetical protein